MKATIIDRLFIFIIKRIWSIYSTDEKVLHRTNIKNGEPIFSAEGFLFWVINFEYHRKK